MHFSKLYNSNLLKGRYVSIKLHQRYHNNSSLRFELESLVMDNFSTGLGTAARAGVKTGLAVCLAELEQQNLFIAICQFLGLVTKR